METILDKNGVFYREVTTELYIAIPERWLISSRNSLNPNEYYEDSPELLRTLSNNALRLFVALLIYQSWKTHECYPSYEVLGEITGMNKRFIAEGLKELQSKKIIKTERIHTNLRGRPFNNYLILLEPLKKVFKGFGN